jgi:hypothetical protein
LPHLRHGYCDSDFQGFLNARHTVEMPEKSY